jgi:hypothetical protein
MVFKGCSVHNWRPIALAFLAHRVIVHASYQPFAGFLFSLERNTGTLAPLGTSEKAVLYFIDRGPGALLGRIPECPLQRLL